jgi:septum formation protein
VTDRGDNVCDLYLASASPRRSQLLKQIGIRFEVISHLDIDESLQKSEPPEFYVRRLAEEKARAGYAEIVSISSPSLKIRITPVLGADTCISLDGKILGKPVDKEHGIAMLKGLSGCSHKVLTAICLFDGTNVLHALSQSTVTFKTLDTKEIEQYWETGEPADKAGAYAIQGYAARFVVDLQGSFSGVVGLPLYELSELLVVYEKQGKGER